MITKMAVALGGWCVIVVGPLASLARGDVTPASLFTDHAVLQRDATVPVWGHGSPGEHVTVEIANQSAEATTDADGKWMVCLKPMPSGGPFKLTLHGKNTVVLDDILVGDVWIGAGQSNTEYGVSMGVNNQELAQSADQQLRIFSVPKAASLKPLDYIKTSKINDYMGRWEICSPQSLTQSGSWHGFSAVAYLFGRELRRVTRQPVGVIGTYWGGTPAQSWTSVEALQADPLLAHFANEANQFAKTTAYPYPALWADYAVAKAKWDAETGKGFQTAIQAWLIAAKTAKDAGQPEPPRPKPDKPEPQTLGFPQNPTILFNAMVYPVIPYAIKGVIWYQGESNDGRAKEYRDLFPAMIADWRSRWDQGNFPFLFVQIAPYKDIHPEIREAQLMSLGKSPNTAMAVTTDVGNANDIHPMPKLPVAQRLALAARALAYGEKIEYSGPLFKAATFEGDHAIVSFTHLGGGLIAKTSDNKTGDKSDTLRGFTIAGADGKFVSAEANITGDTVIVHADQITQPAAVRYGWENVPDVNLYNRAGLPASPFRSDAD